MEERDQADAPGDADCPVTFPDRDADAAALLANWRVDADGDACA